MALCSGSREGVRHTYLGEKVVFLGHLIQHLVCLDGGTDVALQHLAGAQNNAGWKDNLTPTETT